MLKITIRVDDITPDMNWNNFNRFREIMEKLKIKPLIGVVPDNHDELLTIDEPQDDFWETMRALQNEGWTIAMHGANHCYTTKKGGIFPLNHFSEFAGVPYNKQLSMISTGRKILEEHGIATQLFMAPGHSFDKNTLKALKECGVTMITDGFANGPYRRDGIVFLPIAFRTNKIFASKADGITTWVFHLNSLTQKQLDQIEAKMIQNREKIVNYDCFMSIPANVQTMWQRFVELCLANAKRILVKVLSKVR